MAISWCGRIPAASSQTTTSLIKSASPAENIAAKGHVIAADNFINLKDATEQGFLKRGDKLLLFNFGFGINWSCTILEH